MPSERKKLEAMSELFESEKSYVKDMKIWTIEFRRFFLNCSSLTRQKRYLLNNLVFLNTENIVDIHTKIVNEMASRNERIRERHVKDYQKGDIYQKLDLSNFKNSDEDEKYKDLVYMDIYERLLEQLEVYGFYIHRLPKIEYFLDKEIATNKNFGVDFRRFLSVTGYIVMGYKHFIYRPSQKLSRYPLLLNAIRKNTKDKDEIEKITRVSDFLIQKTKFYDQELGKGQNNFNLYKILVNLEYREFVQMRLATSLFMNKRKIVQILSNVYVRSRYKYKAKCHRLYLFDHMILIVDPISKIFGEKLYISEDPLSLNKYKIDLEDNEVSVKDSLDNFQSKIVLKERDGANSITFLFKIESQGRELTKKILECQEKHLSSYDLNIKLNLCAYISPEKVSEVCFSDQNYIGNSYLEPDEQQVANYKKEIDETNKTNNIGNLDQNMVLRKGSIVQRHSTIENHQIIGRSKLCIDSILNGIEPPVECQEMLFFCIGTFVYMKTPYDLRKIYLNRIRNLVYINECKILVFIDDKKCCWSRVTPNTKQLSISVILNKTDKFWYGKTVDKSFIVVRLWSKSVSSYLQIFELVNNDNQIKMVLNAQLYIGAEIKQLTFFNKKIIVSCPEFEVIDMDTLNTHTFINIGDPTFEWFTQGLNNTHACDIFKIEKGLYLVCNNRIGFFINEYGSSHEEGILFAWYTEPTSFKLVSKYLIVLSSVNIVIYDIKTAEIISYIVKPNLNFVGCTSAPWLHDEHFLYMLNLPL